MTAATEWRHPEQAENEDYVEFLGRAADYYRDNPPPASEHLALIECDAEPRHWPMHEVRTADFYPAPCPYCVAESYQETINSWERRTHWYRHPVRGPLRKVAQRALGWAYSMGIISGYGFGFGGPTRCHCLTSVRFKGRRPYILGRRRDPW